MSCQTRLSPLLSQRELRAIGDSQTASLGISRQYLFTVMWLFPIQEADVSIPNHDTVVES